MDRRETSSDLTARFLASKYASEGAIFADFRKHGLGGELAHSSLARGETLFEQGEPADCLYVLLEGRLGVRIRTPTGGEIEIDVLEGPFTSVGEMALMTNLVRSATVYALEDCELVRVSKLALERIGAIDPPELARYVRSTVLRLRRIQLVRVLTDLFGALDGATLGELQAGLEWRQLLHGETLYRRGDPGDAMYIVVTGRLRVLVPSLDGSGERTVGEVGPGEVVGEFSFLTDQAHSATAVAIRETNVVRLTPTAFERLLETCPQALIQITRIIIQRHRVTLRTAKQRSRASTLALIPAGRQVPLAKFAEQLVESLVPLGSVLHLDSARLDRVYGKVGAAQTTLDDPTSLILSGWMSEQEIKYEYILYVADPTWSAWTQRCVRQADRILVVGQPHSDPTPGPVERAIRALGATARTELVLLHPAGVTCPRGTARWLEQREVQAHHHIRRDDTAHYRCLARRLTGRVVGLVLSGGGARGFGHIGAIRALEEAGLQVDLVGGTSMGALVGGAYALGYDYEGMHELAERFGSPKALFDYTLPLVSFMKTGKVTRLLERMARDAQMEDLWRPFYCVSCNLSRGAQIVHRAGTVWQCIRASLAIPGVFSPLLQDGDLLVDGGAINNLPIDVMRDQCPGGTVIGVDAMSASTAVPTSGVGPASTANPVGNTGPASSANPAQVKEEAYAFGPSVSGWQVLWSRLNPLRPRIQAPSILGSLMQSTQANGRYRVAATRHLADLIVPLPVGDFKMLDFAAHEAIIERGYQATLQALEVWMPTRPDR